MGDEPLTPERIRSLRRQLGLTQTAFAQRLGVSMQAVSFWERGTRTPTGLYAQAIRTVQREVLGNEQAEED